MAEVPGEEGSKTLSSSCARKRQPDSKGNAKRPDPRRQRSRDLFLPGFGDRRGISDRLYAYPSAGDHTDRKYPGTVQRARGTRGRCQDDGKVRVAAMIEEYEFLSED